MTKFMSSHNDARKSSSVFNNGHRIDFFKPFINDTSATYVSKSRGASITFTESVGSPAHVQPEKWDFMNFYRSLSKNPNMTKFAMNAIEFIVICKNFVVIENIGIVIYDLISNNERYLIRLKMFLPFLQSKIAIIFLAAIW